MDLADDVVGASGGDLGGVGGVDGVVNLATGQLALDVGVHGTETSRRALDLTGAAGVDDSVA